MSVSKNVELTTKYLPYVDEIFKTESKHELITNKDFDFDGAHTVKIWKVSTSPMNDYGRDSIATGNWSCYGSVDTLDATTETFTLRKDRGFTFRIDALDEDESGMASAAALARQIREVVVPEVDLYTITEMAVNAGTKPSSVSLTKSNIYENIIKATAALDNAEAPENGRVLIVTPDVYMLMKQNSDITMSSEIDNALKVRGIIATIDGMNVMRVPSARVPSGFGFMVAHPMATVGVQKLASYNTHLNPPGMNGTLIEGRIVYDAFVLENKANGIYYQTKTA